jgi:uncharacterized protein (DUF4415 family)
MLRLDRDLLVYTLRGMITFDGRKRKANIAKHGIDLAEVESAFDSPMADKAAWQSAIDAAPDGDAARDESWAHAVVTHGGGVADTLTELRRARGQRGPQKKPRKTATAIRLSAEVTEFFKASGPGWQTRIDEALREYVKEHKPG